MANVSVIVDSEDLLIYMLNGLPTEFNSFRTSMRTRSLPVSFEELHILLKSEKSGLKKRIKHGDVLSQPTTLLASQSSGQSCGNSTPHNFSRAKSNLGHGRNFGNQVVGILEDFLL